jgi:hypothetical protein
MRVRGVLNNPDLSRAINEHVPDGKIMSSSLDKFLRQWEVPSVVDYDGLATLITRATRILQSKALGLNISPAVMQHAALPVTVAWAKGPFRQALLKRYVTMKAAVDIAAPNKTMKRLAATEQGGVIDARYFDGTMASGARIASGIPEMGVGMNIPDELINQMQRITTAHIARSEKGLVNVLAHAAEDVYRKQNPSASDAEIDNMVARYVARYINDVQGGADELTTTQAGISAKSSAFLRPWLSFTSESAKRSALGPRWINEYQWSGRANADKAELAFRLFMLGITNAFSLALRYGIKVLPLLAAAWAFRERPDRLIYNYLKSQGKWRIAGLLLQEILQGLGGQYAGQAAGQVAGAASRTLATGRRTDVVGDDVLSSAISDADKLGYDAYRIILSDNWDTARQRAKDAASDNLKFFLFTGDSPLRMMRMFLDAKQGKYSQESGGSRSLPAQQTLPPRGR